MSMGFGMSLSTRQELVFKEPISDTCLPRVAAWLEVGDHRRVVVKAVRGRRVLRKHYASDMDWFLAVSMPTYRPVIRDFYEGKAPYLKDILTDHQLDVLSIAMIEALNDVYERVPHLDAARRFGVA